MTHDTGMLMLVVTITKPVNDIAVFYYDLFSSSLLLPALAHYNQNSITMTLYHRVVALARWAGKATLVLLLLPLVLRAVTRRRQVISKTWNNKNNKAHWILNKTKIPWPRLRNSRSGGTVAIWPI